MNREEFLTLAEDAGLPILFRGYTVSHADGGEMYRRMRNDREMFLEKMGKLFDQLSQPKPTNGAPAPQPPWKGANQ